MTALLLCVTLGTDAVERLELRTHDLRFLVRGPRPTRAKVTLVALSDTTLEAWPEPKVFWGKRLGAVLRQSLALGASAVAFDVIPSANIDSYLEDLNVREEFRPDQALDTALAEAGEHAFLAYRHFQKEGKPSERFLLTLPPENVGFIDQPATLDDVARTGFLYDPDAQQPALSLVVRLAHFVTGAPLDAYRRFGFGQKRNQFWINPIGTRLPMLSAERVAQNVLTDAERAQLRGSIVFIGTTDHGSQDKYRLPGSQEYIPGVEALANAYATLLDGRPLVRWGLPVETLLTLALGLLVTLVALVLPFGRSALLILGSVGFWCLLSLWLFTERSFFLPVVGPLLALTFPWVTHQVTRSLEEGAHRLNTERLFGRYVSPEARDYLLDASLHPHPNGEQREVVMMFLDIRGFTSFAEKRAPAEVLSELNGLFAQILPLIDAAGGHLHKFTGDGFIVVFGLFPDGKREQNKAQDALDTALKIVRTLDRVNQVREQRGSPPWLIGCGIHLGVIVCGSLGVEKRSEFTILGDTVNLTARLEALNKELGSVLIVSEDAWELLSAPVGGVKPINREIRGRQKTVTVYPVLRKDIIEEKPCGS